MIDNNPYDGLLSYDHIFETGAGKYLKQHSLECSEIQTIYLVPQPIQSTSKTIKNVQTQMLLANQF